MPRAKAKPRGSKDFAAQVEKQQNAAAEMGLNLLQGIAADPEAGEWGQWAKRLIEGEAAQGVSGNRKLEEAA